MKHATPKKDNGGIASEYRNIATDAVKMLKSIPFYDIKQRMAVDSLFDRLADNDIALQDLIRQQAVAGMAERIANPKAEPKAE